MIGAANRDKRRWSDADELRLDRPDPRPISFGFGAHHCLGAALARMQLRGTLPPLLEPSATTPSTEPDGLEAVVRAARSQSRLTPNG